MFRTIRNQWRQGRRGAIVVLVAVVSTVMVGMTAMTIDLGTMYIVRAELQRAADSAALAAAAKLASYQSGLSENAAKEEAERMVEANPVQGRAFQLDFGKDVVFGHAVWDSSAKKYVFEAGGSPPTAVRVRVRMTKDSPNGALKTMFASIFGIGSKDLAARSAAMIVPRDMAVVADLSASMNDDSELQNYKETAINLWNIWVCLPIEKGNNGVGNGIDPPPPGNPPINDDYGTGPGNPGNRGGADPKTDPGLTGPTWGRMNAWGALETDASYSPANDPGLEYLPYGSNWNDIDLANWLAMVGYKANEISALVSGNNDASCYPYRVAVALGLARWDSGINKGLWSTLPKGKTKSTEQARDGDTRVEQGELEWLVEYPFKADKKDSDGPYWLDYINSYMRSNDTAMYDANHSFRYRYGLKTFVNYLLEARPTFVQTPDLYKTPEQPLQAVKDAIAYAMDLLAEQESDDQVSLEIFAETARHMQNLTKSYTRISEAIDELQAGHYDIWTHTGGGIDKAIAELTGSRSRANAAKIIVLLSDGQANVNGAGHAGDYNGGRNYALDRAQAAADLGIQFYTISVGVDADRNLMQKIAEKGGGEEYFAVGTIDEYSAQLKQIFEALGSKRSVQLIE